MMMISYILNCVFDHVDTAAGGFQIIVCLILSSFRLIYVIVDLSHVDIFSTVSAAKQTLGTQV